MKGGALRRSLLEYSRIAEGVNRSSATLDTPGLSRLGRPTETGRASNRRAGPHRTQVIGVVVDQLRQPCNVLVPHEMAFLPKLRECGIHAGMNLFACANELNDSATRPDPPGIL
jgi:hypothetical protein